MTKPPAGEAEGSTFIVRGTDRGEHLLRAGLGRGTFATWRVCHDFSPVWSTVFQSLQPVRQDAFYNRTTELARLLEVPVRLTAGGGPSWLAILGQRKVGKTSLLLEAGPTLPSPSCCSTCTSARQ